MSGGNDIPGIEARAEEPALHRARGSGRGERGRGPGDAGMHPNQTNHLGHALEKGGNSSAMTVEGGSIHPACPRPGGRVGTQCAGFGGVTGDTYSTARRSRKKTSQRSADAKPGICGSNRAFFKTGGNFEVMSKQE